MTLDLDKVTAAPRDTLGLASVTALPDAPDHGGISELPEDHDYSASVLPVATDSTSGVFKYAAKFHAQTVGTLLILLYTAAMSAATNGQFNRETAVPVIIAVIGAALAFVVKRASSGVAAYAKLVAALLTVAAQVLVPVFWTHEWSWALVPVVLTQAYAAFYTWLLPDGKSPATTLHASTPKAA